MTNEFYKTGHVDTNSSSFGGIIDIEDFDTNSPNKKRITNQVNANNLQETLENKKNKLKEEEKYKNMTLEELRERKLISNTNGRPTSTMTDEKWQKEFILRKLFVKPYPKDIKHMKSKYSKESGSWNEETQGRYDGQTNWQQYCSFINDALECIRANQIYYCYFIYQIMDLAKFHFDDLKTRYCDGYWEVWLER